jgi:3-hydroxybutyryl-CoA dehydrogenase
MVLFVETVGVVGAGTMGSQIAEIFALNGKNVILRDVEDRFVQTGLDRIRKSLDALAAFHAQRADNEVRAAETKLGVALTQEQKEAARKKLRPTYSQQRVDDAFARIKGTTAVADLGACDFVVEAIIEDLAVKQQLFAELGRVCPPRTVFASNTSSLPISAMADASGRPQRFLGAHFFNPPTTLPLVEVIRGDKTDAETVDDVMNLLSSLRNHRYPMLPIPVKECPGFLVNRILGAMLEEAYRCLEEGVASARDIDSAMKAGAGFPMGPLELTDLVGLDVAKHVRDHVKQAMKSYPAVAEPTVLDRLVADGRLGRKAGKGFYDY